MSTPDTTSNTPAEGRDTHPQGPDTQSTSTGTPAASAPESTPAASTPESTPAASTPEDTPAASTPESTPAASTAKSATAGRAGRILVWLSVALAVATWCTLLWGNGIVAAAIAVVGIVLGAIGHHRSRAMALRRLAVTAIIAQLVPAIVVLAYVLVLHFIVV